MSDYDSSSEGSESNEANEQYFRVFQHDFYLSGSLPNIEDWKHNITASLKENDNKQIDVLKYLALQQCIFQKEENYLLAGYHIRYYSYGCYLKQAFEQQLAHYHHAYKAQPFSPQAINLLDTTTQTLTFYLQKLQLSRAESYVSQIQPQLVNQVYALLEKIFPLVISKYCIWRIVMFLEIMNQENTSYIMNTPFDMTLQYYLKTFKTLKAKHEELGKIALDVNPLIEKQDYLSAYAKAVKDVLIFNEKPKQESQKLQLSLLCEFLTSLKYMHFASHNPKISPQQNLFEQYINASLKVPYYRKNDNIPTEYYEKLFLRILTEVKTDPKLTDLALYIDPNVAGERSKESFGKLQQIVLNLCKQLTEAQQEFMTLKKQPQLSYVKKLLNAEQFTLLIQFLQTIMEFNKSAFLKADNQIYETFLDMAEYLKNAFLSFGKDLWLFPQNIFTPLTLGFFKKISEDINDDLKNILYQMVENLGMDKLPQKLVYENGEFILTKVTRLEYLSAIMYYIEDCSRQQEYLNLPQIAPANLQTSILLIKSLHVKLKHHEPNPAQLPLFTEYLKECEKYKLNINFRWFKHESYLSKSFERQTEFQIEAGLPLKQIKQQFRKCLNYRDRQFARKLIEEDYNDKHLMNATDVAALLKYNHGIQNLSEIQNIKEDEVFGLLEQMQTMLAILPQDLFDLPLEEEINVSYLHLLLTFYCSKIKSAKGSEIYLMILQKILINYLKSPFAHSREFRQKYPKFFEQFIYQFHQIEICTTLNELLMEFHEKCETLAVNQAEWTENERSAVNDLREKIEIIREQFLDKLEGSEEDIAMFMVTFTSLIGQSLPFSIFLECLRLFVKLINRKSSLGELTSIDVFLSEQTYKKPQFFKKILVYIEDYKTQNSQQKIQIKRTIIHHLLKSSEILSVISFNELMQLLNHSKKLLKNQQYGTQFNQIYSSMKNIVDKQPAKIGPQWILSYILIFYQNQIQDVGDFDMFEEQPEKKKKQTADKLESLMKSLTQFETNKQFWTEVRKNLKDFKFNNFDFMMDFIDDLKSAAKSKTESLTFRDIWLYFLTQLSDASWTFYYMVKLNDASLISLHPSRDQLLIHLIKKEKLTKQSYPIFKSIINETKNMQAIVDIVMESYETQQNYVENYQFHNKLILINERFPNPKIEECILRWIQVGENKLPLKIPQNYYINFLKKKIKSLPEGVAYDSILKVNKSPDQLPKLNKEVQRIFQLLLYFPFHKFKSYTLSIKSNTKILKEEKPQDDDDQKQDVMDEQQNKDTAKNQEGENDDDQGDWQQEDDQNDDIEIKKTSQSQLASDKNIQNDKDNQQAQSQSQNSASGNDAEHNNNNQQQEIQSASDNDDDDEDNYDPDRPEMLNIFFEEEKKQKLQGYKRYCMLREQLDIYLKSDYDKLKNSPITDNHFLNETLLAIVKELTDMDDNMQEAVLVHMPEQLHEALKKVGYKKEKDQEKIKQLRKPQTKIFQLQSELFSDRGQSDDSEDGNNDMQGYEEGYFDQQDIQQGWASDDDSIQEDEQAEAQQGQNPLSSPSVKIIKKGGQKDQDQDIQLPQLSSQFSKVEAEIKGSQLQRKELIKILQIFLVQLFKLTPVNFKKKQIVFSYLEIMESDLGQIFFESVLTILRMDENPQRNRKALLEQMKADLLKANSLYQLQQLSGLPEFSKYNGLVNFIHLLKMLKQKGKLQDDQHNLFKQQSGTLLPVAEKFIIELDLPIQTNVFSLVLLFIHSKPKVRQMIQDIAISYDEDGVKLTKKQLKRISEAFFAEKAHNSVWEFIESTINYRVNDIDRLIISLDTYSQHVFQSLASCGVRVKQTIEKSNEAYSSAKILSEKQLKPSNLTHIKHYQRLYYITSNLLTSCSQEIKQFYYMNKQICRYLWQDDDQNSDNYNYNKVPKKLLKAKNDIYTNQSFVTLLQLAFRVIYFVKKELYGKVSAKKFARIIHYPKLIIETATMYMHLTGVKGKKTDWKFLSKKEVESIVEKTQMGEYKFKSLIEVYNLILGLLEIESFSSGKFKQLLIPYFTENKKIGLQAPLMFKVPQIDENINGQNIFVTRQCSFDMAFYQVNGEGLFVQFHGQEGSDHGGMIRELMMGWKGVGIGQQDFFIGKILGISFRQSVPYGGYVDLEMCIKITSYEITMDNLQQLDKEIYSSLKFVLENDPTDLGLTFSIMKKNPKNFDVEQYDLKPNGNQIAVTQDNKHEYIKLYLEKYYQIGRELELSEIATGFYTVVPQAYAAIFKPHELMQHLKGQEVCDINVLKAHVRYMQGYTETSVIIKWLWEILEGYNQQQLNKFIQFLTGSPKLPIFNPNFEITIERVFDVKNLPVAHTCFNTLDLPEYPTKDILEKNLLTAIFEGNDNFGIM